MKGEDETKETKPDKKSETHACLKIGCGDVGRRWIDRWTTGAT